MAKYTRDIEIHFCTEVTNVMWVLAWHWNEDKLIGEKKKYTLRQSSADRLSLLTPYKVNIYDNGAKIEYSNNIA